MTQGDSPFDRLLNSCSLLSAKLLAHLRLSAKLLAHLRLDFLIANLNALYYSTVMVNSNLEEAMCGCAKELQHDHHKNLVEMEALMKKL